MKTLKTLLQRLCSLFTLFLFSLFSQTSIAASVGDLLISEVMANPSAVSDANGEWFELFNPTTEQIDLSGLILSDLSTDSHIISEGTSLLINSGDYLVLARNGNTLANGGVNADYVYGSDFKLTNNSDQIIFSDTSGELLRLDYDASFGAPGVSMALTSSLMQLDQYQASNLVFGTGDLGTPGTAGSYNLVTPVPVPGALWLLSSGLLGLVQLGRIKKKTP